MDALFAKADAIQPKNKRRKAGHGTNGSSKSSAGKDKGKGKAKDVPETNRDPTLHSINKHTTVPKSLLDNATAASPALASAVEAATKKNAKVANKKLRHTLDRTAAQTARSRTLVEEAADMLLMDEGGFMEVEDKDMERTWRVGQSEILEEAGGEAARGRKEWRLDGGPYKARYTRNGRHLAIAGRLGHVATFDWQTGTLHSELQLQETCRDITFLHDHSHYAVAQQKYVFVYDRDGVELHCLKNHVEPTHLEFLPYHWLLATVGNAGFLKYQDTSTGQLVASHRTKLGSPASLTQNPHTAVIYIGHQNGTVTLWTPNLPQPAVRLLAHVGPVVSISVDPSQLGGRYMATAGKDGFVKVWDCRNWKGAVREWNVRGAGDAELEWSQRGSLAVASGGTVNVYNAPMIYQPHLPRVAPPLYLTHPVPHRPLTSIRFVPFQDILTIGHSDGLSSILVPGAGEPNFDSGEADPFENKRARREREVKNLLDKIQPDMISLDPDFIGTLAPPSKLSVTASTNPSSLPTKAAPEVPYARLSRYERLQASGKAAIESESESDDAMDEDDKAGGDENERKARKEVKKKLAKEDMEKKKMRGRGKSLKRYLRKQRKNVIDPSVVGIRAKLEKQKEQKRLELQAARNGSGESGVEAKKSALDRFKY